MEKQKGSRISEGIASGWERKGFSHEPGTPKKWGRVPISRKRTPRKAASGGAPDSDRPSRPNGRKGGRSGKIQQKRRDTPVRDRKKGRGRGRKKDRGRYFLIGGKKRPNELKVTTDRKIPDAFKKGGKTLRR